MRSLSLLLLLYIIFEQVIQAVARSRPVRVLLWDDLTQFSHDNQFGEVPFPQCDTGCEYTKDRSQIGDVDAVLFAADVEYYQQSPRTLPTKPNSSVKYVMMFREALSKFKYANKYDFNVTFALNGLTSVPYIYSVDELLEEARAALSWRRDPANAVIVDSNSPVVFVSRACSSYDDNLHSGEDRLDRTQFVQSLMKRIRIDSYGKCLNNKPWPGDYDSLPVLTTVKQPNYGPGDKNYVTRTHKFCLGYENTIEPSYVTEKLWDCLRHAAVPIYKGPPDALQFIPYGNKSAIMIEDFDSPRALGKYVRRVNSDDDLYMSYLQWIQDPPKEWVDFLRSIELKNSPCRLCQALKKTKCTLFVAVAIALIIIPT
eukprot:Rmarinus@m.14263